MTKNAISMAVKTVAFSLIVAGGCMIGGPKRVEAQTLMIGNILLDFSGCGNGSMCTNEKYICTE